MKSKKSIRTAVIIFQAAILILEILPGVMTVPFASGPNEWVPKRFSYFSLTLVGYAEYAPFLAGVLTAAVTILCIINFIKKRKTKGLQNTAFILTVIALILSVLPFFEYGLAYVSVSSGIISILILISAVLQFIGNRSTFYNEREFI